jgi:hypothetical protein
MAAAVEVKSAAGAGNHVVVVAPKRWISMLPLSDTTGVLQRARETIKVEDLCDDPEVIGRDVVRPDGTTVKEMHPYETHVHVTVAYDVPELSWVLGEKLVPCSSFSVALENAGVFKVRDKVFDDGTKHSYDVLYMKVKTNPSLIVIHDLVIGETKTKDPHGEYKPHVTLAYLGVDRGDAYADKLRGVPLEMDVDSIVWARDGDRNAPVVIVPLQRASSSSRKRGRVGEPAVASE